MVCWIEDWYCTADIEAPSSWGKYRHTIALVGSGSGTRRAVFTADLPHSGRWRLAIHLEAGRGIGTYDLTVIAESEERSIEFDGAAAEEGWNALGEFDLSKHRLVWRPNGADPPFVDETGSGSSKWCV